MGDYAGLKAALADYPGETDAQIAAALTADSITVYSEVPVSDWSDYFLAAGFMIPLQAYGAASPAAGASALSITAAESLALMFRGGTAVNLADATARADVTNMLAALVAEGTAGRLLSDITGAAFAATDQAALLAMGTGTTSKAAQLGFPAGADMVQEIAAARKWA